MSEPVGLRRRAAGHSRAEGHGTGRADARCAYLEFADAEFADAASWLDRIRTGG